MAKCQALQNIVRISGQRATGSVDLVV